MDRGLLHESSSLVGEMGEGHGWWTVNNLRPPFGQHNPSLFLPSTTTPSSSHLHSFSSLLLSNHYPLPTTTPWHDSGSQGQLQEPWSHLFIGGLANGEERFKNWEGQVLFPTTTGAEADGSGSYIYSTTTSHGSSTSNEIQLSRSSPWGGVHHHPNTLQQASSPRSSCITSTTSLGSNMLEFSNNSSPREILCTSATGSTDLRRQSSGGQRRSRGAHLRLRNYGSAEHRSGFAEVEARPHLLTRPPGVLPTAELEHISHSAICHQVKEKLGDRITALHQLVSPFGKTDTASVLLEAIGYIRFLHGQIEALSCTGGEGGSCSSSSKQQQQHEASVQQGERNSIFPEDPGQLLHDNAMKKRGQPDQDGSCEEAAKKDLRSRGLCLVPVSCTLDIGADAGPADYWAAAPAFGMGFGR